ncbi:MAG: sugar transferase [Verrucomicrobia bacterium]|nr:sugar transferase [Verrucomicrobiota bacterium]
MPRERPGCATVKRAMDVVLAAAALLGLTPLLLPLLLALRLTGEGEVFYAQERVGFRGRKFKLLKFATMLKNSPHIGTRTLTTKNDPRVLPLGYWLRKTKINELPQLVNVLKGDMSIVGPRPQTEECYDCFPASRRDRICLCKPGLTGVGSVVFRDEEEILGRSTKGHARCYREDIMPHKLELELWYLEHRSLRVDLKLIALTAIAVVWPKSRLHERWLKGLPRRDGAEAAGAPGQEAIQPPPSTRSSR